jgi:hypothetical protein
MIRNRVLVACLISPTCGVTPISGGGFTRFALLCFILPCGTMKIGGGGEGGMAWFHCVSFACMFLTFGGLMPLILRYQGDTEPGACQQSRWVCCLTCASKFVAFCRSFDRGVCQLGCTGSGLDGLEAVFSSLNLRWMPVCIFRFIGIWKGMLGKAVVFSWIAILRGTRGRPWNAWLPCWQPGCPNCEFRGLSRPPWDIPH